MEEIILKNGYVKEGYGYKKLSNENTHWITLFGPPSLEDSKQLQMYAYFSEDESFEKVYDTGIIIVDKEQLNTLINIFT